MTEELSLSAYVSVALIILWVIAALQGIAVVVILRQAARLIRLAESGVATSSLLPVGSNAPGLSGVDYRTGKSLAELIARGKKTVLFFASSDCSACRYITAKLPPEIGQLDTSQLVICWHGSKRSAELLLGGIPSNVPIVLGDDSTLTSDFHVHGFPIVVAIDEWHLIEGVRYPTNAEQLLEVMKGLGDTMDSYGKESDSEALVPTS